ncbi:protein D2-like [Colias croceus]|uniref:protein D2-like n=1 Tax=Colias crocea TaxID=72248 RepID=UPI001E27CFE5|nr:protein D2-like [Colias croceus]
MLAVITAIGIFISSVYAFDGCYNLGDVIQPEGNLSVSEAFRVYNIVPEYILTPPDDQLVAGYPDVEIRLGTKFSPVRTINSVYLNYPNGAENEMYTVMLLDIDASTGDDEFSAYIHGMFLNSPASNLLLGDQIVPYVPAQPMPGTGYHRYVGLLYQQSEYLNPNQTKYYQLARQRTRFSAMDFAQENNLKEPVAGNFFLAEYTMCENC